MNPSTLKESEFKVISQLKRIINVAFRQKKGVAIYRKPQESTIEVVYGEVKVFNTSDLGSSQGFTFSSYDGAENYFIENDIQGELNTVLPLFNDIIESNSDDVDFFTTTSSPSTSKEEFIKSTEKAVTEIASSELDKVVISKVKGQSVSHDRILPFINAVFNNYENCFVSFVASPEIGTWIGATPETLLHNSKDSFKTMALAGTQSAGNVTLKEAVWRQKEIEEQAYVSRYIINCFKNIRLREFSEVGPKTIKAGNLFHLKTDFIVNLKDVDIPDLDQTMLKLLHPTSAVCGMPLINAKSFISLHESHERKFFTGYLGPVNLNKVTELYVNLRCCELTEAGVSFYAGAGITEDSIPEQEWHETELKCETLNSLFK